MNSLQKSLLLCTPKDNLLETLLVTRVWIWIKLYCNNLLYSPLKVPMSPKNMRTALKITTMVNVVMAKSRYRSSLYDVIRNLFVPNALNTSNYFWRLVAFWFSFIMNKKLHWMLSQNITDLFFKTIIMAITINKRFSDKILTLFYISLWQVFYECIYTK